MYNLKKILVLDTALLLAAACLLALLLRGRCGWWGGWTRGSDV